MATPFPYTPSSTNRIISTIFQIYRRFLHFYRRFFIISTVRHRISTYRQFSAIYLCSIPRHYNKKKLPSRQLLSIYPAQYQPDYINDFSNISIVSPLISTIFHYIGDSTQDIDLTTTFDTRNAQHTLSPSNLLPSSTIKKITNKIASIFNATYATLKTT